MKHTRIINKKIERPANYGLIAIELLLGATGYTILVGSSMKIGDGQYNIANEKAQLGLLTLANAGSLDLLRRII